MTVATFAEEMSALLRNEPGYGSTMESLVTDFSEGPIVETGRTLDVAIAGAGFFAVQGEDGPLYTRNGVFHLGEDGSLVNAQGMPVLGKNGPLSIPPDVMVSQIVIATDGTVSSGESEIGQLQLVSFEETAALTQVGTTLFSASPIAVPSDIEVAVQQGVREQSNVSPVDELVAMIMASRYHEAAQRTLKSMDDAIKQQTDPRG